MIGAWRYKNRVLHVSDAILSSLGPSRSKMFLGAGFLGDGWKKAIKDGYAKNISPVTMAADLVTACLRNIVARTMTPDQRAMTLHAIRTDNRSNVSANHFMMILEGIRVVAEPIIFKTAMYELIGALQGLEGEELDGYRTQHLLNDVAESYRHGGPPF